MAVVKITRTVLVVQSCTVSLDIELPKNLSIEMEDEAFEEQLLLLERMMEFKGLKWTVIEEEAISTPDVIKIEFT